MPKNKEGLNMTPKEAIKKAEEILSKDRKAQQRMAFHILESFFDAEFQINHDLSEVVKEPKMLQEVAENFWDHFQNSLSSFRNSNSKRLITIASTFTLDSLNPYLINETQRFILMERRNPENEDIKDTVNFYKSLQTVVAVTKTLHPAAQV